MNQDSIIGQLARPPAPGPPAAAIPTGSPAADLLLGGGWPARAISAVCGGPGSGSSTLAMRAIAAAQLARPGQNVVLVTRDYHERDAGRYGIDEDSLILAHDAAAAVGMAGAASLIVDTGYVLQGQFPARPRPGTAVLLVARNPEDVRTAACIRLHERGSWSDAEPVCLAYPAVPLPLRMRICTGQAPVTQEALDLAVRSGVVEAHGHSYRYGGRLIGRSWRAAVAELLQVPDLRASLLQEVTGLAPEHINTAGVYRQLA